jgi:hypothetical protein
MNERLSADSGRRCLNTEVGIEYRGTVTPLKCIGDVSDRLIFLWYAGRDAEELISFNQLLPVKVPVAAPGRTRNALRVDNEWKVILEAWQQAGHSEVSNSLHGPRRRFPVLKCLAACTLIDRLYRIIACAELLS